jgi:hypothetical protein
MLTENDKVRNDDTSLTKKKTVQFRGKSYNNLFYLIPKLAMAGLLAYGTSIFLGGSFLRWPIWFLISFYFVGAVFWALPIPNEWKSGISTVVKSLLMIGLVVWGGFFIYSGFQTGGWKDLIIGVEETGAEKAVGTSLASLWDSALNPSRIFNDYRDFDKVDVAEENVKKGIEFFDIRTRRPWFNEDDEIVLYGSARITALPETDTKVVFNCDINDTDIESETYYNPIGKLTLRNMDSNSLNVYAGRDEVVSFECVLNGIPLNLSEKKRTNNEEDSRTYTAVIEGIYHDFTTTSVLNIYNIKKEEYDLLSDPEDLIPNKNINGKISSECINGCGLTKVSLTTDQLIQTEIGANLLGIALKKDSDWYGEIESVSKIDVRLPDNFQLIACDYFGGDNILDGSDPHLSVLNQDLKDKKYGSAREFSFYCDYTVARPRLFLGPSEVSVDTTYNYRIEIKKTVQIIEKRVLDPSLTENIAKSGSNSNSGEEDTRYYYA